MQIIDKCGYLEAALGFIEKNIVSGKGLQKIAAKTGIRENSLRTLSLSLKNFSEKQLFTALHEKIEDIHSSLSGADAEISGADISIESQKNKAFILMNVICDIVVDGDREDRLDVDIKIFSKNNIQVN